MLKKTLKGIGIVIGVVVVLAVGFYLKARFSLDSKLNKKYEVTLQSLTIEPDSAMLAEGKRLMAAKGCAECHGSDYGGKVFLDDPAIGIISAINLTKGKGGLPQDFSANDWLRALQHGISRNNTTLRVMPSYEYTHFSEQDIKALIAYGMQLAPVDRELPATHLKPLGTILADLDKLPVVVADKIDHTQNLKAGIAPEVSEAFGKYLSVSCTGCHKENFKGGDPVIPNSPQVADITSAGHLGKWTEEQFITTLRTGTTPEGKVLEPQFMPWPMAKEYTDVELKALYMYLRSI